VSHYEKIPVRKKYFLIFLTLRHQKPIIIIMKRIVLLSIITLIFFGCKNNQNKQQSSIEITEPKGVENVAYKWGKMALTATANDTERFQPRPTITSRYLGLISVAIFDAWSRYDEKAIPVYLQSVERRPENDNR
jgi:hypothetical protein